MRDGLGLRYAFMGPMETIHLNALGLKKYCQTYGETITNVSKTMGAIPSAWLMQTDEDKSKVFCICLFKEKQVGSPTKARAGFLKIGLPLNWEVGGRSGLYKMGDSDIL